MLRQRSGAPSGAGNARRLVLSSIDVVLFKIGGKKSGAGAAGGGGADQVLAVDRGIARTGHSELMALDRADDGELFLAQLLGAAFLGHFVKAVADDGDVLDAVVSMGHGDLLKLDATSNGYD